jgi:hypothetical protein
MSAQSGTPLLEGRHAHRGQPYAFTYMFGALWAKCGIFGDFW